MIRCRHYNTLPLNPSAFNPKNESISDIAHATVGTSLGILCFYSLNPEALLWGCGGLAAATMAEHGLCKPTDLNVGGFDVTYWLCGFGKAGATTSLFAKVRIHTLQHQRKA